MCDREKILAECAKCDEEYKSIINFEKIEDVKLRDLFIYNIDGRPDRDRRLRCDVSLLKYMFTILRNEVICISFRMHEDDLDCAYAYMYVEWDAAKKEVRPFAILCGPSLTSMDGEYRPGMTLWHTFEKFFVDHAESIDAIDSHLCAKLNNGSLRYETFMHLYPGFTEIDKIREFVEDKRIAIRAHMLCWMRDFYAILHKTEENHMNPIYREMIYNAEDEPVFQKLIGDMDDILYQKMIQIELFSILPVSLDLPKRTYPLRVGQKYFPLTVSEYENIGDIRFPTWAEIYITTKCSNLALNYISPSFPFLGTWFFVYNSGIHLYDNLASIDKMKNAPISAEITAKLRKVDLLNYVSSHEPVSGLFNRMSLQINRAINFADIRMNMAGVSLCITSEFVGRTIADSYRLYKGGSVESQAFIFTEYESFSRIIFEVIYAFYCANTRVGVIHSDPHANNITIKQMYSGWNPRDKPTWKKGHAFDVYYVGGKSYAFPIIGGFACLIDLSRGILRDRETLAREYPGEIARDFLTAQDAYFRRLIDNIMPEITMKHEHELSAFMRESPEAAFRVFSGIDTVIACRSINSLISHDKIFDDLPKLKLQIENLLDNITEFTRKAMVSDFSAAISKVSIEAAVETEWVNKRAFEKFFAEFTMTPDELDGKNLVTIYSYEARMKNDINFQEKWGSIVQLENRPNPTNEAKREEFLNKFRRNYVANRQFDSEVALRPLKRITIEPWMIS